MTRSRQSSRYGRWRAASLTAVYVLMGLHVVHWKMTGRTVAPLELNEVLHTLHLGIITAGFVFMAVAVLATSVVGRFFCSWACHMLALEDLCAWLLARVGVHPKPVRSRVLLWVPPLAMAYLFVWPQVERVLRGVDQPTLRVGTAEDGWASFVTTDLWRNLPGPWIAVLTFAVCGFAIVYVLGSRSFCTYVCPYGAVFAAADRLAPGRIVAAGDCKKCGRCTAVCPSQVRVHEEVGRFGAVVSSSCLKDLNCVSACPSGVLSFGFTRPPLLRSWAALWRRKRRYSFSWYEDVIMAGTFMAMLVVFRGLYDAVPFLLALAIAALYAFLAVLCVRLARRAHVRLNNFTLKAAGRLTSAGWVFGGAAGLLCLLAVHSAVIHFHSFQGQCALEELAQQKRAGSPDAPSSTSPDPALSKALFHLETARRWGWVRSKSLQGRLATLHLLAGSPEASAAHSRAVLANDPDDGAARLLLSRALLGLGRTEAATRELEAFIASDERLESRQDHELRSAAHAALARIALESDRRLVALRHYERAVRHNPRDPALRLALGVLLAAEDRLSEAEAHLSNSLRLRADSAAVHNNLGVVQERLGKETEAMRHYRSSLGIQPDNARVHHNLGTLFYRRGQLEEAAESFQAALELEPDYASAHSALALVARDLERRGY